MATGVAIVGAGPYGLSIAAHLRGCGVAHRIFGRPMETWCTQMPKGMHLKSEGFASSLYSPSGGSTLAHYCKANGIAYSDIGRPVALDTFVQYGLAFQKAEVPDLDQRHVSRLEPLASGFRLELEDGASVEAERVIIAVGIHHYAYVPPELASLPMERVSHSSRYADLARFGGQRIVVVGSGASALDCAALLLEAGASVQLVARSRHVRFHSPPGRQPRPLLQRIRAPMSGLGPGWRSRLCTDAPLLFHRMPERFRVEVVRRHLGPAPCWWTKDQVVGKAPFHLGAHVAGAEVKSDELRLDLATETGHKMVSADHVIAATGYQVDLSRLAFLDQGLLRRIGTAAAAPVLSTNFESTVPGLYFVGLAAATSFGPLLRFAFGAGFTARHLSRHLAHRVRRSVRAANRSPISPDIAAPMVDA